MKIEPTHLTDFHRILIGLTTDNFLIEVVIRAIVTYVILLVAMRLMGKRVAGQMSAMELTIIVTLGAAIGVPLQAPDRGMIPAVIILLVAVVYQRGLNFWAFKSRRAELVLQGDVTVIIRDGCLDLPAMQHVVLSRERLFSSLRQKGVAQLGQVKRAYLEADGHFSIYRNDDPPPGLCLIPQEDVKQFELQFGVGNMYACRSCGNIEHREDGQAAPCVRCKSELWSPAVQSTTLAELKLTN